MDKITIRYSISRTVALVEGRNEYGTAEYSPNDTELAFLSVDERKYLDTLDLSRTTFALPTGQPPTWPTIAESIKSARQAALDKQTSELAEREGQIAAALAEPDDKWFSESTDWRYAISRKSVNVTIPHFCNHYGWMQQDPRIVARIESLQPELERRREIAAEQNEQAKARQEAAEAAKIAKAEQAAAEKQAAIDELDAWCVANGPSHLQRAATEGYDVAGGCLQWLVECLRDELNGGEIVRDNTALWNRYDWNERKSPGAAAFEYYDHAKAVVAELAHPTSVTVEVERIMLVEVEPADDDYDASKREFTGIIVNVTHPAAARRCLVVEVKA